ncbi:hypothetical protein CJU90_3559 [Yarrowia sp. C11]|nr:hypothetical protein CKK34_5174 [Yarrowia sp. E02]KAG5367300.1 hypothetical protein CJU90_3559 [Yarrowia sp. C11]
MTDDNKKVEQVEERNTSEGDNGSESVVNDSESVSVDPETASIDSYDSQDPNSEYYNPNYEHRKKPIEEVRDIVKDMEQCYIDARAEMKEMADVVAKYKSLKDKCNKLSAYWYYHGPWDIYKERMEEEYGDEKYEIHEHELISGIRCEFDDLTNDLLRETALQVAKDV